MSIEFNIHHIQTEIADLLAVACRPADSVTLIAASKQQHSPCIRRAYQAGIKHFGENYLQEALTKIPALHDLPLIWHMIGSIQSNKAKDIAGHFDWVHTVTRKKIADLLAFHRPETLSPLNVCIEVNVDTELSKSGVAITDVADLANHIATLPQLKLRGLMCIPEANKTPQQQATGFTIMSDCLNELKKIYPEIDTLSMGMSSDYKAAILAGATHIRIGTAIFGLRSVK